VTFPNLLLREESTRDWSPLGLLPIDAFLDAAPIAPLQIAVDLFASGRWRETELRCRRTPSGVIVLPRLGRRAAIEPGMAPALYRLRVDSEPYIPRFRTDRDGREFQVPAYNDTNPPPALPGRFDMLPLDPGPAYPYPSEMSVLRGTVREPNGAPIRDATISYAEGLVRAMSDERGCFALGLRRAPAAGQIVVDIVHHRTNRAVSVNINLPQDLQTNQVVTIP
jgi:hypothetical protein